MGKDSTAILKRSDLSYKFWLSIVLGIPVIVLISFSSLLVAQKQKVVKEMGMVDNASDFIAVASALVHELQRERGYSSGFIGSGGKKFGGELAQQRLDTDKRVAEFLNAVAGFKENHEYYDRMQGDINLALSELRRIQERRAAIDSLSISFMGVLEYYSELNSTLLNNVIIMPELVSDREITSEYLTTYYSERMKENNGMERALLTYVFSTDRFPPGLYERLLAMESDARYSKSLFLSLAHAAIRGKHDAAMNATEVKEADRMKGVALERGYRGGFGVDPARWYDMQTEKINRQEGIVYALEERIRNKVHDRGEDAKKSLRKYWAVNIFVVGFVVLMAAFLFRNVSKRREAEENLERYAKRMERALFRAKDVLNSIAVPPRLIPHYTVSPVYRSLRSVGGGDTVKWLNFRSRYAAVYIHDVAGHDIEEILLNILATALVDIYKENPSKKSVNVPSLFLNVINEHVRLYCEGTPEYLTALYMLMDFEDREIRIASAGHPRPLLIGPDGSVRKVDVPSGFVLGQFEIKAHEELRYSDIKMSLRPGELLLLYSDGLMEQTDERGMDFEHKIFGGVGRRLAGLEPDAAHDILKAEFEAHLEGRIPDDDVSFIIAGVRPPQKYITKKFIPSAPLLTLIKKHKADRGGVAAVPWRQVITDPAEAPGPDGCVVVDDIALPYRGLLGALKNDGWGEGKTGFVEMALQEMVLNAIMHGNQCSDKFHVELSYVLHADVLEVSVADKGAGFDSKGLPQSVGENLLEESGRGHLMIDGMSDGVYFNDAGTRCWALFRKDNPEPGLFMKKS